jgi:hypothetical protein
MNKRLVIFSVMLFVLSACSVDPRNAADAYQTRLEADQAAKDSQQARAQEQAMNEIAIQDAQREQAIKDAGLAKAQEAYGWMVYWGGIALTLTIVSAVISVGVGASYAIVGSGRAAAQAAMVRANLVYLDKSTGQFPQLIQYVGNGKYSLTDPNDHSTLMLDTRNEPDRVAIRGALAVRHALVMANAASKSADPTGVAMVQPLVLEVEAE